MSAPSRTIWGLTAQLTAALAEINPTPRMKSVLMHALGQQHTQIQLAEATRLDKTTMMLTVDALEKVGHLQRQRSHLDRRARIIVVTEAGARMAAAGQDIVDRVHGEALALLPTQQREIFAEALLVVLT